MTAALPKKKATAVPKTKDDEKKLEETTVVVEGKNESLHSSNDSPVADTKDENVERPDGVKGGEPEKVEITEKENPNQESFTVDDEKFKVLPKETVTGALTPEDVTPGEPGSDEDDDEPNPDSKSKTYEGERVTPALEVVPDNSRELLGDYNDRINKVRSDFREGRPSNNDDKAELARQDVERIREEQGRTQGRPFKPHDEEAPFIRSTPGPDDAPSFSAAEKSAVSTSENKAVVEHIKHGDSEN